MVVLGEKGLTILEKTFEKLYNRWLDEKTTHIWLSVDAPEDLSEIDATKQEVTQPNDVIEMVMPPPKLQRMA